MAAQPIRLHPQNPHYFLWRDKPTVLIGSGEHYGAVINLDFDYTKYLDTLHSDGLNQTRVFSGTFREVPGSFNIVTNTLAPAPGRFVCPWVRSDVPGYANGGNKFDLTKWDKAYFARLKDFVGQAGKRGVVIEFVLFTPLYVDAMWDVSPMNAKNNINGIGAIPKDESLSLKHANLVAVQEAVTRKIVQELNGFDNLYFEICNEPYARRVPGDWEARIAQTIAETEKALPNRHLIAQNIDNGAVKIENPNPLVSIFNFHYATPPDAVTLNYALNKPIGDDETGFKGNDDAVYRKEAWQFLLNGGSVFSHLDYSFTVGHENGDLPVPAKTPGGGKTFRRQMKILKDFIEAFDFTQMKPARDSVKAGGATVYALAEAGKNYAIYLDGKAPTVALDLPAGNYRAVWINVLQGNVEKTEEFVHGGGEKTLAAPPYETDIALKVQALPGLSGAASVLPTAEVKFPLRASADERYLVDAADKPFFYQADTPWMLLFQLSVPEAEEYMADRKAKGFSALQIMMTGFYGMKNRAGHSPFAGDDFSKPNEEFFAHADKVIQKAADMGMFLMIAPLWSGCCGEGWAGKDKEGKLKPLNVNGPEKAQQWGRWLGERYRKYDHIAWLMGGDKNPGESHELIRQLARGIHEAAPRHLMAVHNAPENSSAAYYDDQSWLSLNAAYTYREVFGHISGEWKRDKNVRPIFLSESGYEHESNDGRGGVPFRLRRQAYGAILSGALAGHAYGHRELWRVTDKWRPSLQDSGAKLMAFVPRLFATRAWWKLQPEAGEDLVTQGRGKVAENDYVNAARTADGTLAIVYIPKARPITINLARLAAPLRANWFDPTDGTLKPVQAKNLPNIGSREFAPPEKNAAGESDWILLLESGQ